MTTEMRRFLGVVFLLFCTLVAPAQDGNARAQEDIKSFVAKFAEGDGHFNQKKYAEAASALAAAHELYQRAERRSSEIGRTDISIKPGTFPALRYYGYGFGSNANLSEGPTGEITGSAAGLHAAMGQMWQDAAILCGADKVPNPFFSDAPLMDFDESLLNSVIGTLYAPVSRFQLPVPDDEWRNVVLWSRRAQLMVEYALQKYPAWRTGTREWGSYKGSLQHTGDEALADIKAKLAEAEPEYAQVTASFKSAAPKRAGDWLGYKIQDIDNAIASVKKGGWIPWPLARDIYITKDYLPSIRKSLAPMYTEEGKTMPADALKPLETKVNELKAAMQSSASRWKLSAGKKNASIESKAAASVKAKLPGATVLKTALDTGQWIITKNELGIPRYRSMGVLVLTKVPGQTHPWLVFTYLRQDYSGGGTYSSGGTVGDPSDVRIQAG